MRLLTFAAKRGASPRVGVVVGGDRVMAVADDMIEVIEGGSKTLAAIRKKAAGKGATLQLSKVQVLAPIPRPRRNVFCVGWNYVAHFKEGETIRQTQQELPAHPTFFTKTVTAVNGPYAVVPSHPDVTQRLDWEVELGVVIGKGGKNITEANAMKHIYGYTVINDVSAREIQRQHGQQWFKGKSLDGLCPMGPWIVTADEVKDPFNLRVVTRVNGVTKQDSNTSYMYFKIPRIIASLSAGLTLEPGDIISTGTPEGVGQARTPPEFMKKGDLLETEVGGIGVLRNRIG